MPHCRTANGAVESIHPLERVLLASRTLSPQFSCSEPTSLPFQLQAKPASKMLKLSRTALRFLQFACSLVALVALSSSFVATSYYGYSTMLGSSAVTYVTLMTYSGMLVGLYFFLLVELFPVSVRPPLLHEQLMDVVMGVLLLVAAIVLLISDYVQNCSVYGFMLRCRPLKTAVVFTFLAMAFFFASALLAFCERRQRKRLSDSHGNDRGFTSNTQDTGAYRAEGTPTAARGGGHNAVGNPGASSSDRV